MADSKGNTWTQLTGYNTGADAYVKVWYVANPIVGTGHTFTVGTGGSVDASAYIAGFSGVVTSAPFDQQNGATVASSATIQPGSITPTQADCLIICGLSSYDASALTATINSGFTITDQAGFSSGNYFGGGLAYLVQSTASAVNPTWAAGSSFTNAAAAIASFKPAVATTYIPGKDTGRQARNFGRFLPIQMPQRTARVGFGPAPLPPTLVPTFDPGKQARNFRQFEELRHRPARRGVQIEVTPTPVLAAFVVTCIIG